MPELLEPPVVVLELLLPTTVPVLEDDDSVVIALELLLLPVPALEDDDVAVVVLELLLPGDGELELRAMVGGALAIPKQEKSSMDKEPVTPSASTTSHANFKILLAAKSFF